MGYAGLQPDDPREIGPYRLLGQLGSGGMGQVFLGMSAGGRPIAVKVIRTELAEDPEFRARFRREVAAAQKVSGLFTALVVDADLDSPMPWLATAYVAGPSLTEAVGEHGPLPVRTLLTLAAGLAEGLSAIHAAGVVHGDLKPSNVLLAEDGPRVIDFGISQAAEASAAAGSDVMIGSPGFMSPEQVLSYPLTPASDMFSLGAVLTFAAAGRGPFGTGSNAGLMYRLVNDTADIGGVPAELRPLVGNCLAKHPSDRPDAGELLAQVGAIQPAPGWLAESIVSGFSQDRSAVSPAAAAEAGSFLALTSSDGVKPAPAGSAPIGRNRPGRHRITRPVASVCLSGVLVAGAAVAALVLISADRAQTGGDTLPAAGAGAAAISPSTSPGSSASAGQPSPRSSSAASPTSISPAAFLTPASSTAASASVSPLLTPSPSASGTSSSASITSSSGSGASSSGSGASSSGSITSGSASAEPSSAPPSSVAPSSVAPSSVAPSSAAPSSAAPSSAAPSSSAPASSAQPSSSSAGSSASASSA